MIPDQFTVRTAPVGEFFPLANGYAFFGAPVEPGRLQRGAEFVLNSMLFMWELKRDDVVVGYFFYSAFKVECNGAYVLTFMESKRGKATTHSVLIRRDDFIVFDFPGCGAMAVSIKLSEHVRSIFEAQ